MKIIDADGHIVESADQLREYLEPAYRDTAFDVVTDSRGNTFFLVEGRWFLSRPAKVLALRGGSAASGRKVSTARQESVSTKNGS